MADIQKFPKIRVPRAFCTLACAREPATGLNTVVLNCERICPLGGTWQCRGTFLVVIFGEKGGTGN